MKVSLLAPFRSHLNISNGTILSDDADYRRLWMKIDEEIDPALRRTPEIESVEFLHARAPGAEPGMIFDKIDADGSMLSPELIRIVPSKDSDVLQAAIDECNLDGGDERAGLKIAVRRDGLCIHVMDNTISIGEIGLTVQGEFDDPADLIALVQEYGNKFSNIFCRRYYHYVVHPILIEAWSVEKTNTLVETPGKYPDYPDMRLSDQALARPAPKLEPEASTAGRPLWVNRTLFTHDLSDDAYSRLKAAWILAPPGEAGDEPGGVKRGVVFLGWGHNIVDLRGDDVRARQARQALTLGQFFYADLDGTNRSLSKVLGATLKKMNLKEARALKSRLHALVSSVDVLLTRLYDVRQNLQGYQQFFLEEVLTRYTVDKLIDSVKQKKAVISSMIEMLFQRSLRAGQYSAEIILFLIGGLSVIQFVVSIAAFVRVKVESAEASPANDGFPGLLDVAQSVPPDFMVSSGVITVLVILIVFMKLKKDISD